LSEPITAEKVKEAQREGGAKLNALLSSLQKLIESYIEGDGGRRLAADLVEDICQSVLIRLAKAIPKFRGITLPDDKLVLAFRAFVRTITLHTITTWHHRSHTYWTRIREGVERGRFTDPPPPPDPFQAAASADQVSRLQAALAKMDPIDVAVIKSSFSLTLTPAEVALRDSLSPAAFRQRLSRGLKWLAKELGHEDDLSRKRGGKRPPSGEPASSSS
jgi:RNA polymerase sigma factor (sigma-70 family)